MSPWISFKFFFLKKRENRWRPARSLLVLVEMAQCVVPLVLWGAGVVAYGPVPVIEVECSETLEGVVGCRPWIGLGSVDAANAEQLAVADNMACVPNSGGLVA